MNQQVLSSFIWSVADLLRGDYKQSDYGKVILPFTVLRRLDCVLAPHKGGRAGGIRGEAEEETPTMPLWCSTISATTKKPPS
jgi:type I restriction enzyme M protein